jgi:hypothetical protein
LSSFPPPFRDSLTRTPIKDLGLAIEGTPLEPILREFTAELDARGIRLRPRFYLSTEWGVPFGTISMAIPFYLARPDLQDLHAQRVGHVEGTSKADILRYLRHEMGHVVNYAYRLYEREDWVKLFGSITQPYLEEYRPSPFSRRYVRHLPGWYAQKHPDEDWSETFAVWLTPSQSGRTWREEYEDWPTALAKLEYCDRVMTELASRPPAATEVDPDEDIRQLALSLDDFYKGADTDGQEMPPGLAGALRAIFDDLEPPAPHAAESAAASGNGAGAPPIPTKPAGALLRSLERTLMADVFRWTGHFPEKTRVLVRHLARLADQLGQVYPETREREAAIAITALITALAMNHVHSGTYLSKD